MIDGPYLHSQTLDEDVKLFLLSLLLELQCAVLVCSSEEAGSDAPNQRFGVDF